MNKIRLLRPAVLIVILGLIFSVSDPRPPLSGNSGDDPLPTVEVFAARGVLKVHGRNEIQYRDLAPGSQSLASGSYLKTVGGTADILLPDNSVLSLDANSEVRLGMYTDGSLVAQRSGRVWHNVEWRSGSRYCVDMPYGRATVTGTQFYTIVDWPVQGAVNVIQGRVEFDLMNRYDPQTGDILGQWWQKNLVPEGTEFRVYPSQLSPGERLKAGDSYFLSFDILMSPPVQGRKSPPPNDDSWVTRNRNLGRMIDALRRARPVKHLTPTEYRQKLGDLLGISPALIPNEPLRFEGGLWVGYDQYLNVINFCVTGNYIHSMKYVGWVYCTDKQTHERYNYKVDLSLGDDVYFPIAADGTYTGIYEFQEGVYKGLFFALNGTLKGSAPEAVVSLFSDNDVAACDNGPIGPVVFRQNFKRSPAPCVGR